MKISKKSCTLCKVMIKYALVFYVLISKVIDFGSLKCICTNTLLRKEIKQLLVNKQK